MRNRLRVAKEGHQILVVDDSRVIRLKVSRALERAGFQVDTANNGAEALEKALVQKPDLILLDINMPTMDGWETLRAIRAHPNLYDILVVILSSNAQQSDVAYGKTLGIHSYLTKPVVDNRLVDHLRNALHPVTPHKANTKVAEGYRVLIADDSRLCRIRVSRALAGLHCDLIEAENGKQALQLATKYRPDLILMDINMPRMDGLEATRRIRQEQSLTNTTIVAISSNDQLSDVAEAMEAGMNDFLVKPFSDEILIERVKLYLKA